MCTLTPWCRFHSLQLIHPLQPMYPLCRSLGRRATMEQSIQKRHWYLGSKHVHDGYRTQVLSTLNAARAVELALTTVVPSFFCLGVHETQITVCHTDVHLKVGNRKVEHNGSCIDLCGHPPGTWPQHFLHFMCCSKYYRACFRYAHTVRSLCHTSM